MALFLKENKKKKKKRKENLILLNINNTININNKII